MKVLIIGGGGREHALAWKASQSSRVSAVYAAPGNAGTELENDIENVDIKIDDQKALIEFARSSGVGLTIVGPEDPLAEGIADAFGKAGLKCFGPSRLASRIEGSKTFSKEFLTRHSIPTAAYQSFVDIDRALKYLSAGKYPIVIKADGLAAGKGVIIARDRNEARDAVSDMLCENKFGRAGSRVVIEEFLNGEEASFICMVDGAHILPMASSRDHKAAYDGDNGPNTGGMGAYSPAPIVTDEMHAGILRNIIGPAVEGLRREGMPYVGFLYAGLMIGDDGIPKVLEFNCRLGDPETQPIMMRMKSDLVSHCLAALDGNLHEEKVIWDRRPALGVVMAAAGYPAGCRKGDVVSGLNSIDDADVKVFHAGTELKDGEIFTCGGRVLCVTALADNVRECRRRAYAAVDRISWNGGWCREDIGGHTGLEAVRPPHIQT